MGYWTVTPEWLGERAYILGCGPSLTSAPIADLHRTGRVIAINDSYLRARCADILYFGDRTWWEGNKAQVAATFRGHRIVTLQHIIPGVLSLRCTGKEGLETDPGALRHGSNSGYACLNLAYHLGVSEIVLVGFDMRTVDGHVHWRNRTHDNADAQARTMRRAMLPAFPTVVKPLADAGVRVVNATLGSCLTVWPFVSLQEVIGYGAGSRDRDEGAIRV